MNKKDKRKKDIRDAQAKRTAYNKSHPEEARLRSEQFALEKKLRLNTKEKRRVKKVRKKRIKHLKSLLRQGFITEEQYEKGMETIKKGEK